MANRPLWAAHLHRRAQYALDLGALVAAFWLAYLTRFEFSIPEPHLRAAALQFPVVVLLQVAALHLAGVHRFVWRYVGLEELAAFLRAAAGAAVPVVAARLALPDSMRDWRMPLSVILLDTTFMFAGVLGLRVLRRILYEKYERERRVAGSGERRRRLALLAGAGRAGVLVAREIKGRGDLDIEPVGFVDDDSAKEGTTVHGLRVLGTLADIERLIREQGVEEVVITMAEVRAETVRRVVESCEHLGVRARIMPGLYQILSGQVAVSRFRDVEIEDLLGREEVKLDEHGMFRFLNGRSVLVTGAGGSIGSELVGQIARFGPRDLVLVERAEPALFEIDREVERLGVAVRRHPYAADVGDGDRMAAILARHAPDVILHAAAHKHVPLMERNVAEAVTNNVLATRRLVDLAGAAGVDTFVLVSSDKAVRPTSVMGATKRVAELVVQGAQRRHPATRFLAVRFGNVMGSKGSVIPIFRDQLARGGPLTVTHPEAARYFMTLSEAAALVLQAGAIGRRGEITMLDMGEPIRIVDLAEDMIRLSGRRPRVDIAIELIGLRPGEKLGEELCASAGELELTSHPKIFATRSKPPPEDRLEDALARLAELVRTGDEDALRRCLMDLLPEASLGGREDAAEVAADRPSQAMS